MANEIRTKSIAKANFTITLNSLANAAGRQSDMIDNTNHYPAALVYIKLTSGGTPTANNIYEVYLLRGDDATAVYRTDGAGASDAAITVKNALLLGTITNSGTASEVSYGEFDTSPLGPLGPEWGIAVGNNTGAAVAASGNTAVYVYYTPEVQ